MEIPRHWRLKGQRYRLEGVELSCGHKVFPPRPICPYCEGLENNSKNLPTKEIFLKKDEQTAEFLIFLIIGFIIITLYVNQHNKKQHS